MKKIFVDYDSTLVNFLDVWLDKINSRFGKNIKPEDLTKFDSDILNKQEYYDLFMKENLYTYIVPYQGAIEFMNQLNELGDVTILTASIGDCIDDKQKHIEYYFPNVKVIHSGKTPKHEYTKNAILIDDAVHNIYEHVDNNKSLGILFNHYERHHYNRDFELKENLKYCITYEDCLNLIND